MVIMGRQKGLENGRKSVKSHGISKWRLSGNPECGKSIHVCLLNRTDLIKINWGNNKADAPVICNYCTPTYGE